MITVSAIGARQGDQGSREFHFGIGAAHLIARTKLYPSRAAAGLGLPRPAIACKPGQVADVEPREGVGDRRHRVRSTPRAAWIRSFAACGSQLIGPAVSRRRLRRSARIENGHRVRLSSSGHVRDSFVVEPDLGQRLCLPDFNGMVIRGGLAGERCEPEQNGHGADYEA